MSQPIEEYVLEDNNQVALKIYFNDDPESFVYQPFGPVKKTETERLNPTTVIDVHYEFVLWKGSYEEVSRDNERTNIDVVILSTEQKLTLVQAENADLNDQMVSLYEILIDKGVL